VEALGQWLEQARDITIRPFEAFVSAVENWPSQILNFFDGRGSNGLDKA